jgi:ABC-type antimicrobial peptide transport system permease subunit
MKLLRVKQILFPLLILSWQLVLSQDSIFVSLNAAIDLAFQKNTTIVISNYEVSTSKFALKEAKANFLPKLYLSSGYNRNIDRQVIFLSEDFGGNNAATKFRSDNEFRSSLNLSLPIYSGYNFANKNLAETQYDFQNEAARGVKQSVINATKKAYFNYLIVQEITGNITGILTILLGAIASILLIVGGIGIMNIMLVSVTERTREIGTRLAIGARESDILTQFLIEAVVLSLAGGILGTVLGIVGNHIIYKLNDFYIPTAPYSIMIGFGFAAVVGIAFGYFPARKAARLNPIEALRYE